MMKKYSQDPDDDSDDLQVAHYYYYFWPADDYDVEWDTGPPKNVPFLVAFFTTTPPYFFPIFPNFLPNYIIHF